MEFLQGFNFVVFSPKFANFIQLEHNAMSMNQLKRVRFASYQTGNFVKEIKDVMIYEIVIQDSRFAPNTINLSVWELID